MPVQQGSLDLLEHPIARELLQSTIPFPHDLLISALTKHRESFPFGFTGMAAKSSWPLRLRRRS